MKKGKSEAEVKAECREYIEELQQGGYFEAINYPQQVGKAFGFSQVKKLMYGLPGGKEAFAKLVLTSYGIPGMSDDAVIFKGGKILFQEYKREVGGIQSDDQKEFQSICSMYEIPYICINSVGEMLEGWDKNNLFP